MHLTIVAPRPPTDRGRTNPACKAARHGTKSAYRYGCRCHEAREAMRLCDKRRRHHRQPDARVDPTGTRRRLHALIALGWRWEDLAVRFDTSYQAVQKWTTRTTVHVDTVHRVKVVYDAMAGTPGPSNLSRLRAKAKGWPPPQAWDDDGIDDPATEPCWGEADDTDPDEVAVARALAGHIAWGDLAHPDRVEAVQRMRARGLPISRMCSLLRVQRASFVAWHNRHIDTTTRKVA